MLVNPVRHAASIAVAARVPLLLWGPPGAGKTSALQEMAEAAGLLCEVVIASIRDPSDFAGLPVVADGTVTMAPPSWARRLADRGSGVLFLDEISTAPPAVQAALLRVVLERCVGDLRLPDGVVVVAAANPPEQAADGWDLSAPLSNRFCHLDWSITAREWADGMVAGFTPVPLPTFNQAQLARTTQQHQAMIGAFVVGRSGLLHAVPTDATQIGRAWPSPRSWAMAGRLAAAAQLAGADDKTTSLLLSGAVGPGAAIEYLAWRDDANAPDPEAILASPDSFVVPERGDRAYAALSAITAAVLADNTPGRWSAAWRAIAHGVTAGHADIAVVSIRVLVANRPDGAMPPPEVLMRIAPVLKQAGLFDRIMGT
jgi:MoxR-like ATPase